MKEVDFILFFILVLNYIVFIKSIPDRSQYAPAIASIDVLYTNQTITLQMQPGVSVRKMLTEYCETVPVDTCEMLIDSFNSLYFGYYIVPYKDTQPYDDIFILRSDVVLYLQEAFNYQSYLEIGCNADATFNLVRDIFSFAIGVDPQQGGTHRMTSDDFFLTNNIMFDLIFIDGLHLSDQVAKDIENALKYLKTGGTIVMHDCNPTTRNSQLRTKIVDVWRDGTEHWNGDTWRAVVPLRVRKDLEVIIGDFDNGVGVIRKKTNKYPLPIEYENRILNSTDPLYAFTYEEFDKNRLILHRLLSFDELKEWILDDIHEHQSKQQQQQQQQVIDILDNNYLYHKDNIPIYLKMKNFENNHTMKIIFDDIRSANFMIPYNISAKSSYTDIIKYSINFCMTLKSLYEIKDNVCELLIQYNLKKVYYQKYVLNNNNININNNQIFTAKYSFCSYVSNFIDITTYTDKVKAAYLYRTFHNTAYVYDTLLKDSEISVYHEIINQFQKSLISIKNLCFIHSTTIEPYNYRILIELLDSLSTSGVIVEIDYIIVLNYGYEIDLQLHNKYIKVIWIQMSNEMNYFEIPTIRMIHRISKYLDNQDNIDRNILYMNTLGNNYKEETNHIEILRSDLLSNLIYKYKHIEHLLLSNIFQCIGNMNNNNQNYQYFDGNYWWCKLSYISNLPKLTYENNSEIEPKFWLFNYTSRKNLFFNMNNNKTNQGWISNHEKDFHYCLKCFKEY